MDLMVDPAVYLVAGVVVPMCFDILVVSVSVSVSVL